VSNLTDLTVAEIRDGVAAGTFSAREVASAFNTAVESGRALNAYIVETPELALKAADAADAARTSGELKPLSGLPIGMKDLFAPRACRPPPRRHILEGFRADL
jgi:aspartyl-tRNA(Asn)/glutamyl-tRNA(Gln) amidotransferase subunit A